MASSVGVARGYLRPGFSRSPPFLMIGLLITAGISAFNYWTLSAQYSDLVKEVTELQDHIQIITLKRETAEKRVDALQQRYSEASDQLGQMKITIDEKVRQATLKDEEIEKLQFEAKMASELARSQNASIEELRKLKSELERCKLNNSILQEKEFVLHSTVIDLKTKMAEMSQLISQNRETSQFKVPPIIQLNNDKKEMQQMAEESSVKMDANRNQYNRAEATQNDHQNPELKIDPAFGQFQDTGVEVDGSDIVKGGNVDVGHRNQSSDADGQNENYNFGLWDNRNPKEIPSDDQLEEDDGGVNHANKTLLALPSNKAFNGKVDQSHNIPAIYPPNETHSKMAIINGGMEESIMRPQYPTNKSMSPIVKKMVQMDAFKRSKQDQSFDTIASNSNTIQRRPVLEYQNNLEAMQVQNNFEGHVLVEAPHIPNNDYMPIPVKGESQNAQIGEKSLGARTVKDKTVLDEPNTHKVLPFNEVFNNVAV